MYTAEPFGNWLRRRRLAMDLSQAALAAQVGCSPTLIAKLEVGARRPSRQVAGCLGSALGIPASEHPGFVAWARGLAPSAPPVNEQSLVPRIATLLHKLGLLAYSQSDYATAQLYWEEGLQLWQALGDRQGIAEAHNNLGFVAAAVGDLPRARQQVAAGLAALNAENGTPYAAPRILEGLAAATCVLAPCRATTRLLGAVAGLRASSGETLEPVAVAALRQAEAAARAVLDTPTYNAAHAEGLTLNVTAALAEAQALLAAQEHSIAEAVPRYA